jgi:hypothetical protein
MSFIFHSESMKKLLNRLLGNRRSEKMFKLQNQRPECFNISNFVEKNSHGFCTKDQNWNYRINLSHLSTNSEDLLVKMDAESRTMKLSGKHKIFSKTATGVSVFSIHTWYKDLKIPENVNFDTLDAKMLENILIVSAKLQDEKLDEAVKIPTETSLKT